MSGFFRDLFAPKRRGLVDDSHFILPDAIGPIQGGVLSRYHARGGVNMDQKNPPDVQNGNSQNNGPAGGLESVPTSGSTPVTTPTDSLILRPMQMDFQDEWTNLRWRNDDWLKPWESDNPLKNQESRESAGLTFNAWIMNIRKTEAAGTGSIFAIFHRGVMIGQISLGAMVYGSIRSGIIGYWIDQGQAGHGYIPRAAAQLCDWAFFGETGPRLHRIEIDMIPDNFRSVRVAQKLGFTEEGLRRRYMYINGQWTDHRIFSLLSDEFPHKICDRLN